MRAGGVYEHKYLLGTSIARPLLAKKQVEVALRTGCDALAHGCTGKGNDQVRFELTYKALAPHLPVIAPWREWDIVSREDAIEYAAKHNVPISQSTTKIYSRDRNIWHISHEGGALEDPANAAPDEIWMLTQEPAGRARQAGRGDHRLREGRAGFGRTARRLSGVALLEKLNKIGGEHGIGRIDLVENRFVGMKSRGCYETPGGTLIMAAHPRTGSADARQEHAALQAAAGARLRRDGLQRPVVHAAARGAGRVLRRRSARPRPAK